MTCVLILHIHSPFDMYTKRGTGSQGTYLNHNESRQHNCKGVQQKKKNLQLLQN